MSDDSSNIGSSIIRWEACFWMKFAKGERYIAEIVDRCQAPELQGACLRLHSTTQLNLHTPQLQSAMLTRDLLAEDAHPTYEPMTSLRGLFPVAISLQADSSNDADRSLLVMAGVDDSWMAPEFVALSDQDNDVREQLNQMIARCGPSAPFGARSVCGECWSDRWETCEFCRREACWHRRIDFSETIVLCSACHLALWIRSTADKGVRVERDGRDRYICTSDQPWMPDRAFVHQSCHPDARQVGHEAPFDDLRFFYYRCPHCQLVFFEAVSK
jgi:hypothetical protein